MIPKMPENFDAEAARKAASDIETIFQETSESVLLSIWLAARRGKNHQAMLNIPTVVGQRIGFMLADLKFVVDIVSEIDPAIDDICTIEASW